MLPVLSAIEYVLPETAESLADLERSGQIETPAERLRAFGFDRIRISAEPAETLAARAIARLLDTTGIDPASVDALFHAGALPVSQAVRGPGTHVLEGFNYPVTKLQYELGLERATVAGVSQAGCTGLMTAIRLATDFLSAHASAARVICSSADVLPHGAPREFMYNVISDGACAVLVERDGPRNRLLAHRQVTKGYYWDAMSMKNEIIAAYFPTAQRVVQDTLQSIGLSGTDIARVIPHNVSLRSWEILMGLLGLPRERLFADNIAPNGHVIAADNFINLKDATDRGLVQPGDRLLLFNFGFGANWACMVIEH
jgi:3-oxoacyl-[acyl-carrier-protein] synthase III